MDLFGGDSCSTESDEGDDAPVPTIEPAAKAPVAAPPSAALPTTGDAPLSREFLAADDAEGQNLFAVAPPLPPMPHAELDAAVSTRQELHSPFPPCAIECLHLRQWAASSSDDGEAPHLVACGTYKLVEADEATGTVAARREGKLVLYSSETSGDGSPHGQLEQRAVTDTPAILDLKWARLAGGRPGIVTAGADGTLRAWSVDARGEEVALLSEVTVVDRATLSLAVDWNEHSVAKDGIASSHHDGSLSVARLRPDGLALERNWAAHAHGGALIGGHAAEVWTVAWARHAEHTLFSGAEDATLKMWDVRSATLCKATRPGSFDAGVTSIAPHPTREYALAVGSYDGCIRMWDTRALRAPTATFAGGGGVWRLKWHPDTARPLLLAACMRGGCHVISTVPERAGAERPGARWSMRPAASYAEHGADALAYGVDWLDVSGGGGESVEGGGWSATVCSCSFYEHSVRLWSARSASAAS